MLWFYEKMSFLDDNELKPTVSNLNVITILEENVKSEILLSRVLDVNTCVLENKISSGSDTASHGIHFTILGTYTKLILFRI